VHLRSSVPPSSAIATQRNPHLVRATWSVSIWAVAGKNDRDEGSTEPRTRGEGENFERRIESTLNGVCNPILRRVHSFGDLDLHDADGVDLGDIDILAFDPSSQSLYIIEAKALIVARTPRELQNEVSNIHVGEHSAVERLRGRYEWVLQNYQEVLESLNLTVTDITVVPLIVIDADLVSARFESPFDIVTLDSLVTYMQNDSKISSQH
jgi:hypothetical protein